jgi:hypothetical protein
VAYFKQPPGARRGLSGFKRKAEGPTVEVTIDPRVRRRRRRKRSKVAPKEHGIAGGRKRRKAGESSAWRAGTWAAGEDYEVEAIRDSRVANQQDEIDYADAEGANVVSGATTMYYVEWKGWGTEYNSWEPYSFIQDDELIREYDERAESTAGATYGGRLAYPDDVTSVRSTRASGRGRARLEALCVWRMQEGGEAGDGDTQKWVHVSRRTLCAVAFRKAKSMEADMLERQGGTHERRVDPHRNTRAAVKRASEGAETEDVLPPRRRSMLRSVPEEEDSSTGEMDD